MQETDRQAIRVLPQVSFPVRLLRRDRTAGEAAATPRHQIQPVSAQLSSTGELRFSLQNVWMLLAFTAAGFAVMGYHPGLEDDAVYLSAVKSRLNPLLYPHDAQFFLVQLQATVFDKAMAAFVRLTTIPVDYAELLWQLIAVALIVFACWRIARRLFPEPRAHWAGVAMVSSMLTLPVAGTALNLADQHLHPRNLATALILLAVSRSLDKRSWQAAALLLVAALLHPIMAALGISLCCFLTLALSQRLQGLLRSRRASLVAVVPLGWIFEPPSASWRQALATRRYYFLFRWTWYEWLGAIAPLVLFWLLRKWAQRRGDALLARFALAVVMYGVFQQAVAMVIDGLPGLIRITPLQPMRFLHLVYFFLALIAGCFAGKYLLGASAWRWAAYLLVINLGMFAGQRAMFGSSPHLEIPGREPANPWLQAFAWIRQNTPLDAYFAMDPDYLASPGEDFHSFRALAERSQLADAIKDAAVVTQVPELGPAWRQQVAAAQGWSHFQVADFRRLRTQFGVDWVLVSYPAPNGLDCRWHNASLAVCRIP